MSKKSIVTEYMDISAFSGAPAEARHHLIFGRGMRDKAEQDGIWIPLLHSEHNLSAKGTIHQIHGNPAAEKLSKICGQLAYEKNYYHERYKGDNGLENGDPARESFFNRYGISYL